MRGRSEVPKRYEYWGAISLIAAILGNRIWYEKHPGDRLYPNLYTILIGPSAGGKGTAIGVTHKFARKILPKDEVFRGKTTGANLSDLFALAGKAREEANMPGAPEMYLIFPELSMSIGEGPLAKDFVKRITEQFTADDYEFKEGTRTKGNISYQAPIINMFMGSTEEWMYQSISRTDIRSGFFGRVIPVCAAYNPNVRISNPFIPADADVVAKWLMRKLEEYRELRGPFCLSDRAQEIRTSWYGDTDSGIPGRPAPTDPDLFPSWKRADDLVLKVALLLAVADGQRSTIMGRHMTEAIVSVEKAQSDIPTLIKSAGRREIMQDADHIANVIERMGTVTHTTVLKRGYDRGMRGPEVKEHLSHLIQQGKVKQVRLGDGPGYKWVQDLSFAQLHEEEGDEED